MLHNQPEIYIVFLQYASDSRPRQPASRGRSGRVGLTGQSYRVCNSWQLTRSSSPREGKHLTHSSASSFGASRGRPWEPTPWDHLPQKPRDLIEGWAPLVQQNDSPQIE